MTTLLPTGLPLALPAYPFGQNKIVYDTFKWNVYHSTHFDVYFYDEERDSYVLQGYKVLDRDRLAQMKIPDHETVIEFPRRMMQFFPEVNSG